LKQKEQDFQDLANYPEKQENIRGEIEKIKSSIREITDQTLEKDDAEMMEVESSVNKDETKKELKQEDVNIRKGGVNNAGLYWGIGIISFFSLIGLVGTRIV